MTQTNSAAQAKRAGGAKASRGYVTGTPKSVHWFIDGKAYETAREPGLCPKCGALDTVTELPPPLRDAQTDGTTHVCHPSLGGCNHGFARTVTPSKYSAAAREIAAYEADIYKAKRNARVAKKMRGSL